jgi:prevent-host-death family protein
MRLSTRVKPISYVKANAAEILDDLAEPMAITKNGEVKAVLVGVTEYEETQETLALLKMLAMGMEDVRAGRTVSIEEAFAEVLAEIPDA